jgi:hypothetical protein
MTHQKEELETSAVIIRKIEQRETEQMYTTNKNRRNKKECFN